MCNVMPNCWLGWSSPFIHLCAHVFRLCHCSLHVDVCFVGSEDHLYDVMQCNTCSGNRRSNMLAVNVIPTCLRSLFPHAQCTFTMWLSAVGLGMVLLCVCVCVCRLLHCWLVGRNVLGIILWSIERDNGAEVTCVSTFGACS